MNEPVSVLVVDDDPLCGDMMRETLTDMGYSTTVATGGREAMSFLLSPNLFDVVLSDIVMHDIWGPQLQAWCQVIRPGLPFVFFSGSVEGVAHVMQQGDLALTKPVTREGLQRTLTRAIKPMANPASPGASPRPAARLPDRAQES